MLLHWGLDRVERWTHSQTVSQPIARQIHPGSGGAPIKIYRDVEIVDRRSTSLCKEINMQSTSASKPFVISRTFDAPNYRVWNAWTDRDRLMDWFGPRG